MDIPGKGLTGAAKMKAAPPSEPGMNAGAEENRPFARGTLLFLGVLPIVGLLVLLATTQDPVDDPYEPASAMDGHRHPFERNAWLRVPVIPSRLSDIHVLPETDTVWIAAGKSLLHSTDFGRTWAEIELPENVQEQVDDSKVLWFPNAEDGWYLDANWFLQRTGDGGRNWQEEDTPSGTAASWRNLNGDVPCSRGPVRAAPPLPLRAKLLAVNVNQPYVCEFVQHKKDRQQDLVDQ